MDASTPPVCDGNIQHMSTNISSHYMLCTKNMADMCIPPCIRHADITQLPAAPTSLCNHIMQMRSRNWLICMRMTSDITSDPIQWGILLIHTYIQRERESERERERGAQKVKKLIYIEFDSTA